MPRPPKLTTQRLEDATIMLRLAQEAVGILDRWFPKSSELEGAQRDLAAFALKLASKRTETEPHA